MIWELVARDGALWVGADGGSIICYPYIEGTIVNVEYALGDVAGQHRRDFAIRRGRSAAPDWEPYQVEAEPGTPRPQAPIRLGYSGLKPGDIYVGRALAEAIGLRLERGYRVRLVIPPGSPPAKPVGDSQGALL